MKWYEMPIPIGIVAIVLIIGGPTLLFYALMAAIDKLSQFLYRLGRPSPKAH